MWSIAALPTQTYAKDTFNGKLSLDTLWDIVEAEKSGSGCDELSDGDSLYFDGVGPRQLVSKELNLQDSRLVVLVVLGSASLNESVQVF